MTDKEIIKALECCSIDNHIGVCKKCPFTDMCDEDEQALQKQALNLINRLKAEIERLKNAYKQCAWERDLFSNRDIQMEVSDRLEKEIKAEAIKEFAKRLKKKAKTKQINYSYRDIVEIRDIDSLVKEMVGDAE